MRRYRWGTTVVLRGDPIAPKSLFTHDENIRMTESLEREKRRVESLQAGAKAGNPVAAALLRDEFQLSIYRPSQAIGPFPARCLRCGGHLIGGKCEGRWIEETVEGRRTWRKCQAIWITNGGLHASAVTS